MTTLGGIAFNENLAKSLILNASYEPINVVNWQKAIILWLTNKVEVLEYHSFYVRSAHKSFQLPSVIRLKKYIRIRLVNRIRFSRENIYLRDNFTCQYCCQKLSFKKLTLDHVIPVSKKGGHTWENVVTACGPCNNKKGDKTVQQMNWRLLNKPIRPKYLPEKRFGNRSISSKLPHTWLPYLNIKAS